MLWASWPTFESRPDTIHGFFIRKAESPRDRSNGPENYMDRPLRIWSRSLAGPSRITANRIPGPQSGKAFSKTTKSHGHTREGSDLDERQTPFLGYVVGYRRRPKPSESSRSEKPPKEYSTPPKARGLLSGTNTRVPEEERLMVVIR